MMVLYGMLQTEGSVVVRMLQYIAPYFFITVSIQYVRPQS